MTSMLTPRSPRGAPAASASAYWGALIVVAFLTGCLFGSSGQIPMLTSGDQGPVASTLRAASNEPPKQELGGWKSVDVFVGDERLENEGTWFAQVKQDEIVSALFRHAPGFFVDLASNNAVVISNSFALERHGWNGLCIEPNPTYWFDLSRRRCQVVAAVVSQLRNERVRFNFNAYALGGIVGDGLDNGKDKEEGSVQVRTVPLLELFQRYDVPKVIDYFSLDVEGAESLVLNQFPFDHYQFKVLTIERPKDDVKALLLKHGYELAAELHEFGEMLYVNSRFKSGMQLDSLQTFGLSKVFV